MSLILPVSASPTYRAWDRISRCSSKLQGEDCEKILREKRSGIDARRSELTRCLEYLRESDTLLVTKIDRLARSTSHLYRIVTLLAEKSVAFKITDDAAIDATSRTGKLVMGILALSAEFENDIRRERQIDGITKAKERGVKFGRTRELTNEKVKEIKALREAGETVPVESVCLPSVVSTSVMSA